MAKHRDTFFFKGSVKSIWQKGDFQNLISNCTSDNTPLSKHEKGILPLFNFNMENGSSSNAIVYPTSFVVLELDTPQFEKEKIKKGDTILEKKWINRFTELFKVFENDNSLCYHTMYLTSSMRGIRFILQLESPVSNKYEYENTVNVFLKTLVKHGVDKSYHDIRSNQAWFFPTFSDFFSQKKEIFFFDFFPFSNDKKRNTALIFDEMGIFADKELRNKNKLIQKILIFLYKRKKSITKNYQDWVKIGFALINSFPQKVAKNYFILFSQCDFEKYEKKKCVLKFTSLLNGKPNGSITTIGTIVHLAKKQGYKPITKTEKEVIERYEDIKFWSYSPNEKKELIKINQYDLCNFLSSKGYGLLKQNKNHIFIKCINNVIREVSIVEIKQFVKCYFIEKEDVLPCGLSSKDLLNKLMQGNNTYFGKGLLDFLDEFKLNPHKDTKNASFIYYSNGVVKVTKDGKWLIPYNDLEGYVWIDQILDRNVTLFDIKKDRSDFSKFVYYISGKNKDRTERAKSIIGYLLHCYKDARITKAVIFTDELLGKSANGGTGKSLLAEGIAKIRIVHEQDGRNFNSKSQFKFQQVSFATEIMSFDDVSKNFEFEKLFSVITNGITIERKNKDSFRIPYEDSPKVLITSNYPVYVDGGESELRRKIILPFSNTFNKEFKPRDKFKKAFFIAWDESDWNRFDNFILDCIKSYLLNDILEEVNDNHTSSLLIAQTDKDFAYYAENILIPVIEKQNDRYEFDKKVLYIEFLGHSKSKILNIKQRTFTDFLKKMAEILGYSVEERKSNGKCYIHFIKK